MSNSIDDDQLKSILQKYSLSFTDKKFINKLSGEDDLMMNYVI